MITAPAGYLAAASRTHAPRWRVRMLNSAGTPISGPLPIIGGTLAKAASTSPRTRGRVTIPTQLAPALIDQTYLPTGQRLLFEYAIEHFGVWVTIADLDVVSAVITRPDSIWEIEAVDRAARVGLDDTTRGGWSTPQSGTLAAAIQPIVNRTFPGTVFSITGPTLTITLPSGGTGEGDPWQIVQGLAAAGESEVFFRAHDRVCVVRPVPDVGAPVDAVSVGDSGVVTGIGLVHEMGYNAVALTYKAKATGGVIRTGTATDTRTTSPVAVQRIGSHVVFAEVREPSVAPSQAEADAAAVAVLRRAGGRSRAPTLRHVSRPWLEPGDTINVTYPGGPTEPQVVDSISLPLDNTNIQVTTLRTHAYQMGVPV